MNLLKMLSVVGLFGMSSFFLGCDGVHFKNDPLKDYNENIRNAVPEKQKPAKEKVCHINKNDLRFIFERTFDFEETVEGSYEVIGRALVPKECEIESMELFMEENSYDITLEQEMDPAKTRKNERKGYIRWAPPIGVTGAEPYANFDVNVKLLVKTVVKGSPAKKSATVVDLQKVQFHVAKKFRTPNISVAGLPAELKENSVQTVLFEVEDLDAGADAPTLAFITLEGEKDLSPYLQQVQEPRTLGAGRFEYAYKLNLSGRELTTDRDEYTLRFRTYSKFGVPSRAVDQKIMVYSQVKPPDINVGRGEVIPFTIGEKTILKFEVEAQGSEGWIGVEYDAATLASCQQLALTCTCTTATKRHYQSCEISGTVPAGTTPQVAEINLKAKVNGLVPLGRPETENEASILYNFKLDLKN